MSDLIQLSEAEIVAVAGGTYQSIGISANQSNSSSVSQSATSSNSGTTVGVGVGLHGYGLGAAAGSQANNTAVVTQTNVISAANVNKRFW